MQKFKVLLGMVVLTAFVLAACSSGQPANNVMEDNMASNDEMTQDSQNDMMDDGNDDMMDEGNDEMSDSPHDTVENSGSDDMMEDESSNMGESGIEPAWYTYQFTDAATGETFSISDLKGKVVLVETMAMWCSNCMQQQRQVKELHNLLGERDDFVSIGINIDPEESLEMLAAYVGQNEFDWLYGVASNEIIADIGSSLGGQFLNPPSTPIVIIDKNGNPQILPFGIKSADTLLGFVEPYLNN